MKVNVLKGTMQIGGAITEITSDKGTKIIIDFGKDLAEEKSEIWPEIDGLTIGEPQYDAVFITHNHIDHIGWIHKILDGIEIYIEATSWKIYTILADFNQKINLPDANRIHLFEFREKYIVGKEKDMIITPYRVDHSAFNSAMFKIECDNKTALHTGDFRTNGYTGKCFEKTLKELTNIDLLITEGTCFSRYNKNNKTEEELSKELGELFKQYDQVFVMQATTNIDRITTLYKAAMHAKMCFVEDLYMATIASNSKKSIPNPSNKKPFANLFVYKPKYLWKKGYSNEKIAEYLKLYDNRTINSQSWVFKKRYVINIRESMKDDIEKLNITNGIFIYSLWNGYIEKEESVKEFIEYMEKRTNNKVKIIHTSGHADLNTVKRLLSIIKPKKAIAIHTENKELLNTICENAQVLKDNQYIIV